MNLQLRRQLDSITQKNAVFSVLVKEDLSWIEILTALSYYDERIGQHNKLNMSGLFTKERLFELEAYGVDYNHIDNEGSHFLLAFLNARETKNITLSQEALEYLIQKTQNIYRCNHIGENILFSLVDYAYSGLEGKDFFHLIKKYPTDLHIQTKRGHNLFNKAILIDAPYEIKQFFIQEKLSLKHLDSNGFSLLHHGFSLSYNRYNIEIFNHLIQYIDPTIKNKFNTHLLGFWLDIALDENTDKHTCKKATSWLTHFVLCVQEHRYALEAKDNIYEFMEAEQYRFEQITPNFKPVLLQLRQEQLENKLVEKASVSLKRKI